MFGQKSKSGVLASFVAKIPSADARASEGVSVARHAKGRKAFGSGSGSVVSQPPKWILGPEFRMHLKKRRPETASESQRL